MIHLHTLVALVLCGLRPGPQLSEAAFSRSIAEQIRSSGVPGAALVVARDGKVIHRQASGLADVEREVPYSTDLAFEIGSLSKQFTGCAILMLVADGKLALADPIGSILPDLPEAWRAATVEQVMHHVSGIPDYEAIAGYDYYNEPRSGADIVRRASERSPPSARGSASSTATRGTFS